MGRPPRDRDRGPATRPRAARRNSGGPAPTTEPPEPREGWDRYYRIVARIPRGRVLTYGAVAELAGQPRFARHVGFAMAALHGGEHELPWHRVLGARTKGFAAVSIREPTGAALQRLRLEAEGVVFDGLGRVALARFGYRPRARR